MSARSYWLVWLWAIAVLAWPTSNYAIEPATGWYSLAYQTDDGLPSENVTGVAQTKDGYLWLGTQSGLARFDGIKAERIPVPLGHSRPIIRSLLCDHDERFWLGQDGGVVVRMSGHEATMFTPADGLSDSLPLQIVEAGDRNVWIAFQNGTVCRISNSNRVTRFAESAGLSAPYSLAVDAQGALWFAKDGWAGIFDGTNFARLFQVTERNAQILPSRRGGAWVATSTHLTKYQRDGTAKVAADFDSSMSHAHISALFEDSAARLWIGTAADGLLLMDGTNLFRVGTSQNNIHTVTEDREGNIWIGTDGGGLDRLRPRVVELRGRGEELPFETVRSLCEDNTGSLWVATQDGGLTRLTGERWTNLQSNLGWPGGLVHCVAAGPDGAVWIGTLRRGLYRWQDGVFTRFAASSGLSGAAVRSLMVGRHGELWIGLESPAVVQRFYNGTFETFPLPEGTRAVRAMTEDTTGQIWMGTLDGRLLRWHDQRLEDVTEKTTEPFHPIRCLAAMADGTLWIGYAAGGVGRLKDGHFSRIRREQGLYDNNICAFLPDDAGRMWLGADRGLFYADLAQLNAVADGGTNLLNCVVFGRDDGVPGLQVYYGYSPGALRTRAGQILFPTHSGIAVVHPDRARANTVPPIVVIERASVAGKPVSLREDGRAVRLAPGLRDLAVTFTAPSFIGPEQVHIQYRLEGWNDDWVESGRERTANYARLPPGEYVFRVTARNNSGIVSQEDAVFRFVLEPFFWQSGIFYFSVVALFALGLAALVRHFSLRRARIILREAEQQTALQKERERIAQDMHDELGAQFTQISLLGELARTAATQPEKSGEFLGKISEVARSGVKSLDEIVWAVNPRNDMLADLLDYTGQFALNFLSAAGIQCRLDFPDDPPSREISGDIRHAVFLIVKEALNNVVRHAQASRVRLVFDHDAEEMRWSIEDNGLGFTQAPDNALADGLRNMEKRATALGGRMVFKSATGFGTKIQVRIPWRK